MPPTKPLQFRLDGGSGVPVYRQIIDNITLAIATGQLESGAQLPTVRQLAVELEINPNTVSKAYRELEIRRVLTTQQGVGTFVTAEPVKVDEAARERRLSQLAAECAAKVGAEGFKLAELIERLKEMGG